MYLRNFYLSQGKKKISLIFSFKNFIILDFFSMTHLGLVLVYGTRYGFNFSYFFEYRYTTVIVSFVERLFFSPQHFPCIFAHKYGSLHSLFYSIDLVLCLTPLPPKKINDIVGFKSTITHLHLKKKNPICYFCNFSLLASMG